MKFLILVLTLFGGAAAYGQYVGDKVPSGTMLDTDTGEVIFPASYSDFYYSNPQFEQYSVVEAPYRYDVPYSISNGTVSQMTIDCSSVELALQVEPSAKQGTITIVLPRNLIDSKKGDGKDDIFFVLLNSKETKHSDIAAPMLRILVIPFSSDTSQVSIIGVNYPEQQGANACNGTHVPPFSYFLSPIVQFQSGIQYEKIQCKDGLVLVQKYDGTPACVKSETKRELYNRGWTLAGHLVVSQSEGESLNNTKVKVDLSDKHIPMDSHGRIDYNTLAEIVSKPQFEKILLKSNVEFDPEKIEFFYGTGVLMYTESAATCGYVIADDKEDYWLQSSMKYDTLEQARVLDDNPSPCTPRTEGSCFCHAQKHKTKNTLEELSYFDSKKEQEVAEIVFNYTITGNKNITPKFKIGKYNLDYEGNVTGFCGEFWGHSTSDYFTGLIQNDNVIKLRKETTLSPLCAIKGDAKYYGELHADTR